MLLTHAIILAVGIGIGVANGANDVSKGIATLVGSGVTNYRRAIIWGTAWTAIGGVAGAWFATSMVSTFGSGLLAPEVAPTFAAALATMLGATFWVIIATATGLPVSTTHALVGSLAGAAVTAYGFGGVQWQALGGKVALPLLVTPFLSLLITILLARLTHPRKDAMTSADCACASVGVAPGRVVAAGAATTTAPAIVMQVETGTMAACATTHPRALRCGLDHLHWLTSGATSFARGMNDAPKIVALTMGALVVAGGMTISPLLTFLLITAGMVIGSLAAGFRVTRVLAENVTKMDHREGFLANLVTACLVAAGAAWGLPMSTTHVSGGAIIGTGAQRHDRALNARTVRSMILAWVVTIPCAILLGILSYLLIHLLSR